MKKTGSSISVSKKILRSLFLLFTFFVSSSVSADHYQLVYSLTFDRAEQISLEGAIVSGDLYGRMIPETGGITRVFYYLDGSSSQFKTEFRAPYDLNGGPIDAALPYDTTALSDGAHTIRAEVLLNTGEFINFDTNITVANQGPPQNIAPVLNTIGNQSVQAGSSKTVSISASDADNDTLTITASGVPNFASFTDNGNGTASLVLNPTTANVGSSNVTITVSDGVLTDSETFTITVTDQPPQNSAPVLNNIGNQSVQADGSKTIAISASDIDNDTLTITASGVPNFANFTDNGNGTASLVLNPTTANVGSSNITVTVSDGALTDSETIQITVTAISNSPYSLVSSPGSNRVGQTPLEGAIVSGDLYGRMLPETGGITRVYYYLDGATTEFKRESQAPYDLNGGPASGARPYDTTALSDGAHTIRAEVLLNTGQFINFDTNITVANQGPPQNSAPVLNTIGNQSVQANNSKTITISASDVDNDALTVTASGVPNFASFTDNGNGTASLVLNPTTANVGSSNITVTVSDGALSDSETFTITVTDQPPQNSAPVLNSIGNQSVQANNSKTIAISASDADNDTLTITASGVPNFANFTDNGNGTASLVLNPTTANVGSSNVTVTVSDGVLTDTETIQITVTAISNSLYSLVSSPGSNRVGQTPLEGATVSGDLYGRMIPETGGITRVFYYLDGSGSQFKSEFRAPYDLNGGPIDAARPYDTTALSDGAHTIRAEVLLNTGEFINFDTHITVTNQGPPQNSAPVLNTIGNQSVQADSSKIVSISANDADNDTLTINASGVPNFASFTDNGNGTASLQLDPLTTDTGNYNVTVTVSDGRLSDSETIQITVTSTQVSTLPVIELNANLIVDEPKNPGTFRLTSDTFSQDTGVLDMGVEFRGSTSQEFDKKSFSLELVKADDPTDELKLKLLDLRKDGDWILDASYRDTSFVRNIIGHDIFNDMRPFAFIDENGDQKGQAAIRGHLSEVFLNGQYDGVYVLSEKVDRKLLGLKKITVPTDANGDDLFDQIDFSDPDNGSVLYKASTNFATLDFLATAREDFEQKYPKLDDVARWEPLEDLITFIGTSSDADFINGIGNIIDIDSVVDYWLLMNVISDTDSFNKNYYLARSGPGKFFFAPWDNDASFSMWWDGSRVDWTFAFWAPEENALIRRLINLTQTGFNTKVKQRWNELRSTLYTQQALIARFEDYHSLLDAEDINGESARERNLARWPDSGNLGSANPELGTVAFINGWISDRLAMLDSLINGLPE